MSVLHIMDRSGHRDVLFDPSVKADIITAEEEFNTKIREGYQAFGIDAENKSTRLNEFNPTQERTVMFPQLVGG
jgi:hypothetical protein